MGAILTPFIVLLCRKLELPLVSGPAEGESFHLPEPELLLMWPIPLFPPTSRAVPPLLFFITHFPFLLSFKSPENLGVVVPTCLWQQQAKVAALAASGPRPSGKTERHVPQVSLQARLLMALPEVHSLCLPWALALMITGFTQCPLRKGGSSPLSALPPHWSPGFSLPPGVSQAGTSTRSSWW